MNMVLPTDKLSVLKTTVANAPPKPGHGVLVMALSGVFPDMEWKLVHSRHGWHRVGGVVDRYGNRVADNLLTWIEQEGDDDLLDLFVRHEDDGLLATKLCGITHYLVAKTGDKPWEFVQIEVNELREVADRELFNASTPPDAVEDLLSPDDPALVDPTPLGPAYYELRKAWDIKDAYESMSSGSYGDSLFTLRFFEDWQASSAAPKEFCKYFVLKLTHFKDRFGEQRLQATPVSTLADATPPMPGATERGVDLSHFLLAYDRSAGYPMAWYFNMIAGGGDELRGVAHAVHEDVTGVYDYLPERDIAVLKAWIEDKYAF